MEDPTILPLQTAKAYAAESGAQPRRIYGPTRVNARQAIVTPAEDAAFFNAGSRAYDFPEVVHTRLKDVVARGKSNILTTRTAILIHELMDLAKDVPPEMLYGQLGWRTDFKRVGWRSYDPFNVHYLPEAAVFTDWTSANYAHWLTEVLPRIVAFVQDPANAKTPIVLDLELHANMRQSVALLSLERPMLRLPPHALVRVGQMHHVSVTGYIPFKLREGQPLEGVCHGLFNALALRNMVKLLRKAIKAKPSGSRPKLFIRRNSVMRRLVNQTELEAALVTRGFVAVEPERLTLEEQVAAFSEAGMIVGATGAAMANLIFCRPDCPIVVLMPRFRHTAYWYWRHMAAAAGAGPVVHVSGPQEVVLDDPWLPAALHQDFRVELKDVLEGIDRAMALSA